MSFTGLGLGLGNLARISTAQSRSISAENPTGEKGCGAMADADPHGAARELGRGWKCRPCVGIAPGETYTLAEIDGPGALQSMWFGGSMRRELILRIYWDGQEQPSLECPLPDFFALPWQISGEEATRGPLAVSYTHLTLPTIYSV